MLLRINKTPICKAFLGLYIFSLAFFDKSVFFGYDAPHLYIGLTILIIVPSLSRDNNIVLPRAVFYWQFFLIAILLSSLFAISQEKTLYSAIRFMSTIIISLSIYNLVRLYHDGVADSLNYYLVLSIFLSILGIVQFVEFNIFHNFRLYFPPTNLTYMASGDAGAVAGNNIAIFRATATFAEPSWLGYFLVPALVLSITRFFQSKHFKNLASVSIVFVGLLSTLSFGALSLALVAIVILTFSKLIWPLMKRLLKLRLYLPYFRVLLRIGVVILAFLFIILYYVPEVKEYVTARLQTLFLGNDPSFTMRVGTVSQALGLFEASPFVGIGAGNYRFASARLLGTTADVSINSGFFLILAEMGVIGIAGFCLILWKSFRTNLGNRFPSGELISWILLSHFLLLMSYNWWYHPLLWTHLTVALAVQKKSTY